MQRLKSICVYCSASKRIEKIYEKDCKDVGKLIAKKGLKLVYGGGRRGLMGLVANTVMENNGYVIGYIPDYLVEGEEAHEKIQELHVVPDMHVRKMSMYESSDAFIILPGGFGTLEEFFEVFVWKQIRLHNKPIVIINTNGYWDALKTLMKNTVDEQFSRPFIWDLVEFIDDVSELPAALKRQIEIKLPDSKWA